MLLENRTVIFFGSLQMYYTIIVRVNLLYYGDIV